MGSWSDWSPCTEECDTGEQMRTRPIQTPSSGTGMPCSATEEVRACNEELCLRINHLQVIGSHNSYKQKLSDSLQAAVDFFAGTVENAPNPQGLEYGHPPLAEQFGTQAVRQIEIDVWVDREGGKFAEPFGPQVLAGLSTAPPPLNFGPPGPDFDPNHVMQEPGHKVFHIQDIDFRSQCLKWSLCLEAVEDWSSLNPNHLPIMILVELKEEEIDADLSGLDSVVPDIAFAQPTRWEIEDLIELEEDIRRVFHDSRIIRPDDVRAGAPTLYEGIQAQGWPRVSESRGKVLFALDNEGDIMNQYVARYPSLEGAILFTSSPRESPEAGFRKENDPLAPGSPIAALVADGFLVRTRADVETVEARSRDTTRRDAALASGAQFVSTDYREANPDFSDYSVGFPGLPAGAAARCNPVSAPPDCISEEIEP